MPSRPTAYFLPEARLPFVQPKPPAGKPLISLAVNESAFGCSPKALAAARARLERPNRYPDPASTTLRAAIGRAFGLDPERIVCGNGSEELLDVIGRMFARPGDQIVMSQTGFFQFGVVAARVGAGLVRTPERDLVTDVRALMEQVNSHTKIVFLAVPNNPTGTVLPLTDIQWLHGALPASVVLVLDCAYGEFLPEADMAGLMALAGSSENVIVTRSFSKAFGLAAFRVGWAYAPAWMMPGLNMLRGVGNINAPGQEAATAALDDLAFMREAVRQTAEERAFLADALQRLGLTHVVGLGNFVLTKLPEEPGRTVTDFLAYAMAEAGIWLRPVGEPGLAAWTRIGLGTRAENELLVATLTRFLGR